jgi:hypothetical protein
VELMITIVGLLAVEAAGVGVGNTVTLIS